MFSAFGILTPSGLIYMHLLPWIFLGCQTIVALTFAEYVLKPLYPDCAPPQAPVIMLAAVCICKLLEKLLHFSITYLG